MIYIGYFLGYAFLLTIQFDIYLTDRGVNISVVYYIIQWAQLIYVFILGPFMLVFYESNENMPMVSCICPYFVGQTAAGCFQSADSRVCYPGRIHLLQLFLAKWLHVGPSNM